MSAQKPKQFGPEYGAQFGDASVVAAYRHRPPYPAEVFDILVELIGAGPRVALDAGCGSGDLAMPLARIVERVDAVDPSAEMIAAGKARSGGNSSRLRWITASMEDALLSPPYGLVTAGESLHWMDWPVVLCRFRDALVPGGVLAIVERREQANPWWPDLLRLIQRFSTNRDYAPYDLVELLEGRGLFKQSGARRTQPVPVTQTLDDYIESIHSRNGFSRDRMISEEAAAFDIEARRLLEQHASDGVIRFAVCASVVWGAPCP